MKRWISIILSLLIIFTFTACGNEQTREASEGTKSKETKGFSEQIKGSSTNQQTERKTLIAYFSLADIVPEYADAVSSATPALGNTQSAAMEIQSQVGGDLFAIKTVQVYPSSHQECSSIAGDEMQKDARPELATHVENMEDYEIVYIGYPIWWYIEPMAIRTFLEEYDFSGKTVIPFCTTLGAGIKESQGNIASLARGATILNGITLRTENQEVCDDISEWLSDIGMK